MHRSLLPLDILILLFGVTALTLGVIPAYDPNLSYPIQVGILVGIGVYFAVAHGIANWEIAYTLGRVLLVVGTAYALLILLQYDYLGYVETPGMLQQAGHLTTLLPNLGIRAEDPDAVATFLEAMIPLGIVLMVTSRRWWLAALWAACALLCGFAVLLTFSAGALVAVAITLVLTAFVLARHWLVRLGLLVLTGAGMVVALWVASHDASALSRLTLYRNSLFVASDYLFTGIGLGDTFPLVYSRYGLLIQVPFLSYTHNLPLAVWLGQGLPGLFVAVVLVVVFYLFVGRVMRTEPRRIFHAAWLAVTAALLHGLFDSRQYVEALWLMPALFGLIGFTAATGRMALADWRHDNPGWHVRYVPWRLAAAGAVLLIAGALFFNQALRAAWYTNLGALAETRGELAPDLDDPQRSALYERAQADYQQALAIDPAWPNANRRSGNLYVKMEDFAPAVAPLEAAYALEPTNPAAIKGLGLAYVWTGQLEEAAAVFRQLENPADMANELTVWAGWRASDEKHQPLLSAYAYETAQLINPDDVNTILMRVTADAYRAAGDSDRARGWYERLLEITPDDESVQQALADLNAGS